MSNIASRKLAGRIVLGAILVLSATAGVAVAATGLDAPSSSGSLLVLSLGLLTAFNVALVSHLRRAYAAPRRGAAPLEINRH